MSYFLGVDVGGSKTHALIADGQGQALGFARAGAGNWEGIGYDGLTRVLEEATLRACQNAGIQVKKLNGAGFGIGGFDWPSQLNDHLEAIKPLGLTCPLEVVNDAVLGILAGTSQGWGISVVAGSGCNCRGWSKDLRREGRVVGGSGEWSGEAGGASDIVARAMQAVTFEWDQRGPATAMTALFLRETGAKNLVDLVEGMYTGTYRLNQVNVRQVFEVAKEGDEAALEVVKWAGEQLGQQACGVIRQLDLEKESFDVVLIGSMYEGHVQLAESVRQTIHQVAPGARLVRLGVPPVVGAVLLGMKAAGLDPLAVRNRLIETTRTRILNQVP